MRTTRVTVPTYDEGLDPLMVPAVQLFIVMLLVEMRWCEFRVVRDALGLTTAALSVQLRKLCDAGYVQTCLAQRCTSIRLTPVGCDRLTRHIGALQAIVTTAGEFVATATASAAGRGREADSERNPCLSVPSPGTPARVHYRTPSGLVDGRHCGTHRPI